MSIDHASGSAIESHTAHADVLQVPTAARVFTIAEICRWHGDRRCYVEAAAMAT